jgi:hypothetical protein
MLGDTIHTLDYPDILDPAPAHHLRRPTLPDSMGAIMAMVMEPRRPWHQPVVGAVTTHVPVEELAGQHEQLARCYAGRRRVHSTLAPNRSLSRQINPLGRTTQRKLMISE